MRKLIGTILLLILFLYMVYQHFAIKLIASAVEQATGAPVKIKQVHLKPFPLEFGIYGMKIMNLKGYQEPEMISIPEIFVRLDLSALLKKTIRVERVVLSLDHVTVEKSASGKINIKEVLDRSKKQQKETPAPSAPPAPGQTSKKSEPFFRLQIDETEISLGKVIFVDYGSGQRSAHSFDLKINHLVLHNVTDMDSLTEQVAMLILKGIGMSVLGVEVDRLTHNLEEQANQLLTSAKGKLSEIFK